MSSGISSSAVFVERPAASSSSAPERQPSRRRITYWFICPLQLSAVPDRAADATSPASGALGLAARAVARDAAPLLGGDVAQRLGERPAVAGRVLRGVLALAVLEVRGLHQDARAGGARAAAVGMRVVDADHHGMAGAVGQRRPALAADVADDQVAAAEVQLRAVVVADLHALDGAERVLQPSDGLAHVGV